MSVLYPDVVAGQRLAQDRTGFEATIQYIVDEQAVSSGGICNAHAAGLQLGSPHPCIPGIEVIDIAVRPVNESHEKFIIDYTFRAPEPEASAGGEFSMTGSLTEKKTTLDRNGQQAKLTYTYPATYKEPVLAGQTREQVAELDYAAPTLLLSWRRLGDFATVWPHRDVFGKLNEFSIWGFAPERLFCTRMEIERANETWREIFEFQEGNWSVESIFRQEDDNRPVPNPDANSLKQVDAIPLYDFGSLGLLLPT